MHYKSLLFATLLSIFSFSAFAETVNLNKADASAFRHYFKGIGVKKAQRIIAYRTQHEGFKTIAEIMEVKGIGKRIFARMQADLSLTEGEISAPTNNSQTEIKAKIKEKIKIKVGEGMTIEIKKKQQSVTSTEAKPEIAKVEEKIAMSTEEAPITKEVQPADLLLTKREVLAPTTNAEMQLYDEIKGKNKEKIKIKVGEEATTIEIKKKQQTITSTEAKPEIAKVEEKITMSTEETSMIK